MVLFPHFLILDIILSSACLRVKWMFVKCCHPLGARRIQPWPNAKYIYIYTHTHTHIFKIARSFFVSFVSSYVSVWYGKLSVGKSMNLVGTLGNRLHLDLALCEVIE